MRASSMKKKPNPSALKYRNTLGSSPLAAGEPRRLERPAAIGRKSTTSASSRASARITTLSR